MYDPKTGKFTPIDTCFQTHHLQFDKNGPAVDERRRAGSDVVGWLDVKKWDATHDAQKSQGWTPLIVDTNGNGKRDDYDEPGQPVDPNKDKRVSGDLLRRRAEPARRLDLGLVDGLPRRGRAARPGPIRPRLRSQKSMSCPSTIPRRPMHGYWPRGMNIDRNGVVWVPLASGHLGAFDRRKCEGPLNGPKRATGKQCPEGWTLYPFPGPQFQGLTDSGIAEASYYTWVDQWNTFGLGENVPMATGNANDAMLALVDGKWVMLRVPYPMGFFAKGMDGRIDDPNAGWKGRGLWATYGTRTPFHIEGGKGTTQQGRAFPAPPRSAGRLTEGRWLGLPPLRSRPS